MILNNEFASLGLDEADAADGFTLVEWDATAGESGGMVAISDVINTAEG